MASPRHLQSPTHVVERMPEPITPWWDPPEVVLNTDNLIWLYRTRTICGMDGAVGGLPECLEAETVIASTDWEHYESMGHPVPRKEAIFSLDSGLVTGYKFGGRWRPATTELPPYIQYGAQVARELTGQPMTIAVCNYYRDENDSVTPHADNEPTIVRQSAIVSISLGATRIFTVKRTGSKGRAQRIKLRNGDILIMLPGCQENFSHGVPKDKCRCGPRVNITFRWQLDSLATNTKKRSRPGRVRSAEYTPQ